MKALRRFFKLTALLVVLLVTLAMALLGWIYFHPEPAVEFLRSRYFQENPRVAWSALDLKIGHLGGLKFQILFAISHLKISDHHPSLDIQVPSLRGDITLNFPGRKILISQLELHAEDSHFTLSPSKPSSAQKSHPEKNVFQQGQSILKILELFDQYVQVDNLSIETGQFKLYDSDGSLLIESELRAHTVLPNQIIFQTHLVRSGSAAVFELNLKGQLSVRKRNSNQPLLLADLRFEGFNLETDTHITIIDANRKIQILTQGPLHYKAGTLRLFSNPEISLAISEAEADLQVQTHIKGLPGLIPQVKDLKVQITTPLKADQLWGPEPSQFLVTSPIELLFIKPQLRRTLEKSCECQFPLRQMFQAKGQAWLAHFLSLSKNPLPVLRSHVSLASYKNKLLEIALAATVDIDKHNGEFKFYPVLDSEVKVHKFQGFRPLFQAYRILIPAPMEVLDGSLHFEARGPVSQEPGGSRFPLSLKTDLTSERQSIKTETHAQVIVSRDFKQFHFEAKAKIHSFQLELPPLDPAGGIPRVTADRRIQKKPARGPSSRKNFKMTFDLEVETPQAGAIRLLAEYFKPYIPLTLHLKSHGRKNMSGFLEVEPFQVVYLKRRVNVERIHLGLEPLNGGGFPVEGRLRVQQTLYTIYIDILGNTKNPVISLSSDPYLPESEIISVLLYDRTSDQLISADAETAGSVQAAIADRAIGLMGLWVFASTPIRSFHYNPVTRVYTATVILAGDVTAGIGSDWESATHVELHKRISKRWLLTARWTSNSPDEPENSELVLQWERRF